MSVWGATLSDMVYIQILHSLLTWGEQSPWSELKPFFVWFTEWLMATTWFTFHSGIWLFKCDPLSTLQYSKVPIPVKYLSFPAQEQLQSISYLRMPAVTRLVSITFRVGELAFAGMFTVLGVTRANDTDLTHSDSRRPCRSTHTWFPSYTLLAREAFHLYWNRCRTLHVPGAYLASPSHLELHPLSHRLPDIRLMDHSFRLAG